MALSGLMLFEDTPAFAFDHMMAHRTLMPGVPWLLDPMQEIANRADKWHLDHQQAHNDAMTALDVASHQNLVDASLAEQGSEQFWTLANNIEHLTGMARIIAGT